MATKEAALQKLKSSRDSFWFSLGAYALLMKEPARSQVSEYSITVKNDEVFIGPKGSQSSKLGGTSYQIEFSSSIPRESALAVVQRTFYAMLSDSYETTKTAAPEEIKMQDWYHFSRYIRNAIVHNGRWHFRNSTGLPAKWRHLSIDESMQGQTIDGFIGWYDGLQLGATMQLFVSELPDES